MKKKIGVKYSNSFYKKKKDLSIVSVPRNYTSEMKKMETFFSLKKIQYFISKFYKQENKNYLLKCI